MCTYKRVPALTELLHAAFKLLCCTFPIVLYGQTASTPVSLNCSQSSMVGTAQDNCVVQLNRPAPSAGLGVTLSSGNTAVKIPARVTVPAGATSATFSASVTWLQTYAQPVVLSATAGGVSRSFTLQLVAAAPAIQADATSVAFGAVPVKSSATQSVTLKSVGNVPTTLTAATTSGGGFSLSAPPLPATLKPGQAITLEVEFSPATAGTAAGQLMINSTSLANGRTAVALTGSGAQSHVSLSWSAPAASADPIAGYQIYRATSESGPHQLLNASPERDLTFVDNPPMSGQTYLYFVTAVDGAGMESVPSNTIRVSVP